MNNQTISFADLSTHETLELSDMGKLVTIESGCLMLDTPKVQYVPDDFISSVIDCWANNGHSTSFTTRTGYGSKIKTLKAIDCADNRRRRVYAKCFSNVASYFIMVGGVQMFLRGHQL